jgi:putative ABC transport system permease protein
MIILLFIILCTGTLLCHSVRQGAKEAIDELLYSMATSYKIAIDKTQTDPSLFETTLFEDGSSVTIYLGGVVDPDFVDILLHNAFYSDYNVTKEISIVVRGITLFPGLLTAEYEAGEEGLGDEYWGDEYYEAAIKIANLCGTRKSICHDLFTSGALKFVEGRHVEPADVGKVVISNDLAKQNNLSIGDTFTIESNEITIYGSRDNFADITLGKPMLVEIIGFFEVFDGYDPPEYYSEWFRLENYIFLDIQSFRALYLEFEGRTQMNYDEITFFIDDPSDLDRSIDKLNDLDVEWRYYTITKGDSRYESSSKPLHTIRSALTVVNIFLLFGCGAILFLILKSQQQSRKRETGILLSIGISRLRVMMQFLAEAFILLVLAFFLAVLIAPPISQWFSYQALSAGLTMSRVSTEAMRVEISMTSAETIIRFPASPPEELNAYIGPRQAGFVGLVTTCVVALSALLSFLPIVRMKPMSIPKMSR